MGKKSGKVRVKQVGGGANVNANALANLMKPPDFNEDLILPPTRGDPNVSIPWPNSSAMKEEDESNFVVIYPTYMDSNKSVKVGRRIGVEDAVEFPVILDLSDACRALRLRHIVQPWKGYPRDPDSRWNNPGRILVDMEKSSTNKKALIKKIAKIIPTMPTRVQRVQQRLTKQKQQEELFLKQQEEKVQESVVAASKKSAKGGNKKKSNKKR